MSRANYNFMPVSWRTLVKAAGVIVLALPAILRAQDGVAEKQESRIEIKRRGSQPPTEAPAEHFTGRVRIEPLFQENDPSHTSAAYVTFEPGAHSAWHTHPLGQILIVTAGTCWVQRWGDAIEELRPGDAVWIPPGQKHWHGASPTSATTHIAIQGAVDGKNIDWMEKVTEEEYNMKPSTKTNAQSDAFSSLLTLDDIRTVAPALARYTKETLADLWKRPGLSARDRSLVTIAALIARNQMTELPSQFNRALDNGVKASEVSEVITHLAFYSGWANAMSAVAVAKGVFRARRIEPISFLPPQVRFFPSIRRLRRNAQLLWSKTLDPSRQELCNTPAIRCFMTFGCAPHSRRVTAA